MLVFSAFVPHSPLLTSTIGKELHDRMSATHDALLELGDAMRASEPEILIIVSSHGPRNIDTFSANLHETYTTDLSRFGDYSTRESFKPDIGFIDRLQRRARHEGFKFTLNSDPGLDHGTSVPLLKLAEGMKSIRIVPIHYATQVERNEYIRFGKMLRELIEDSSKRIALIASGDLSHCRSEEAPLGFLPEGEVLDELLVQAVEQASTKDLLSIDDTLIFQAGECAFRPLLILLGTLEGINIRTEILHEEAPMGVTFLVARFHT